MLINLGKLRTLIRPEFPVKVRLELPEPEGGDDAHDGAREEGDGRADHHVRHGAHRHAAGEGCQGSHLGRLQVTREYVTFTKLTKTLVFQGKERILTTRDG